MSSIRQSGTMMTKDGKPALPLPLPKFRARFESIYRPRRPAISRADETRDRDG
jgi:hypothetical protein